jgi:hypothetical protein
MPPKTIRLSQTAPWNPRLTNPYRTRYAELAGRYFRVEADNLAAPWFVWETTVDDRIEDPNQALVAMVWNLRAARLAIQLRTEGKSEDEISEATSAASRAGTGRNHPRNVAARRNRR